MRLLTRPQYDNTVRDLLGDESRPSHAFPAEATVEGFENNAELHRANPLLVSEYQRAAESIAEGALARGIPDRYLPCTLDSADPTGCGHEFIARFLRDAYRRPPLAEELSSITRLFDATVAARGFETGLQWVIEAVLQAPQFLYRVDAEPRAAVADGVVALGPWEMASRLSFFLWNSMPDTRLFELAEQGGLQTPEEVEVEARRMLDDPRARGVVLDFHRQWIGLDELGTISRDAPDHAEMASRLPMDWRASIDAFIDHVFWEEGGTVQALFSSPTVFVNGDLATVYGVESDSPSTFSPVAFDSSERAGLLTQPALLALLSLPEQSSPVRRGVFVRERILCDPLPPPPPNVDTTPPDLDPNLTTQERFALHSSATECATCHRRIDSIGFSFENYDALGRYRTEENGSPIDTSGSIFAPKDVSLEAPFDGAIELSALLAQSSQVRDCVATQWYRYAFGRMEGAEDSCNLAATQSRFNAENGNLRELLVALTVTDGFRYRPEGVQDP